MKNREDLTVIHTPVLLEEVMSYLRPAEGKIFVDCTLGEGGHAERILQSILPDGILVGIDLDSNAVERSQKRLAGFGKNLVVVRDNFKNIHDVLDACNIGQVDGIIVDLGVSSLQLESSSRGFSFKHDSPLDMCMDEHCPRTAGFIINNSSRNELEKILYEFGQERWAKRIADFIIKERRVSPIKTTHQLVRIIAKAMPLSARPKKIHYATKTFQAIRIAVNQELENLTKVLPSAIELLKTGSRLCVISFHSLEDRIVKNVFREHSSGGVVRILTKKPVVPTEEEVFRNPRSRSAKLRVVEKLL